MKNILFILLFTCSAALSAQTGGRKDTVKLDSTQVEKIKKMPMDTTLHKMPVVPLPPEKKDTTGPVRKSPKQKKQPV